MKKIIVVVILYLLASSGYCLNQPQNIGSVKADVLAIPIVTLAQMNVLTPDATGQLIYVSDAVSSKVCVSTGAAGATVIGAFVGAAVATGSLSTTALHCN